MTKFLLMISFCKLLLLLFAFSCTAVFGSPSRNWSENVSFGADGTVLIENIPQVAQRGGYCVPSSIEMILRYYGANNYTDKRLGGLFRSRRGKGTFMRNVVRAFSKKPLSNDFRLTRIYELWNPLKGTTRENLIEGETLVRSYLDAIPPQLKSKRRGIKIEKSSIIETFDAMDPAIAKKAFLSCRKHLRDQLAFVAEAYIPSGIPISWCTFMNFDPENRDEGSHVRVICGYRKSGDTISEILYRDSWEETEKIKSVSLDDATVMTIDLYLITPIDFKLPKLPPIQIFLPELPAKKIHLAENTFLEMLDFGSCKKFACSAKIPESLLQIGKYEITQKQYQAVMGNNPSFFVGENLPVENISWEEAIEFCKRLTFRERAAGNIGENQVYTLPTCSQRAQLVEDEEEFINETPDDTAWLKVNSEDMTHPVGEKKHSAWGVYDMHGNVSEWMRERRPSGSNFSSESILNNARPDRGIQRDKTIGFRIVLIELTQ